MSNRTLTTEGLRIVRGEDQEEIIITQIVSQSLRIKPGGQTNSYIETSGKPLLIREGAIKKAMINFTINGLSPDSEIPAFLNTMHEQNTRGFTATLTALGTTEEFEEVIIKDQVDIVYNDGTLDIEMEAIPKVLG